MKLNTEKNYGGGGGGGGSNWSVLRRLISNGKVARTTTIITIATTMAYVSAEDIRVEVCLGCDEAVGEELGGGVEVGEGAVVEVVWGVDWITKEEFVIGLDMAMLSRGATENGTELPGSSELVK